MKRTKSDITLRRSSTTSVMSSSSRATSGFGMHHGTSAADDAQEDVAHEKLSDPPLLYSPVQQYESGQELGLDDTKKLRNPVHKGYQPKIQQQIQKRDSVSPASPFAVSLKNQQDERNNGMKMLLMGEEKPNSRLYFKNLGLNGHLDAAFTPISVLKQKLKADRTAQMETLKHTVQKQAPTPVPSQAPPAKKVVIGAVVTESRFPQIVAPPGESRSQSTSKSRPNSPQYTKGKDQFFYYSAPKREEAEQMVKRMDEAMSHIQQRGILKHNTGRSSQKDQDSSQSPTSQSRKEESLNQQQRQSIPVAFEPDDKDFEQYYDEQGRLQQRFKFVKKEVPASSVPETVMRDGRRQAIKKKAKNEEWTRELSTMDDIDDEMMTNIAKVFSHCTDPSKMNQISKAFFDKRLEVQQREQQDREFQEAVELNQQLLDAKDAFAKAKKGLSEGPQGRGTW